MRHRFRWVCVVFCGVGCVPAEQANAPAEPTAPSSSRLASSSASGVVSGATSASPGSSAAQPSSAPAASSSVGPSSLPTPSSFPGSSSVLDSSSNGSLAQGSSSVQGSSSASSGGPASSSSIAVTVDPAKSLVIAHRAAFSSVEAEFTMGRLLMENADYINQETAAWNAMPEHALDQRRLRDRGVFALNVFKVARDDVNAHNDHPATGQLGTVPVIVNSFKKRVLDAWADPETDPAGPFHMLAVVNRLDVAGDLDQRGGGVFAGKQRRWFGEGRLVFGFANPLEPGVPYPMTFIMEYRLPALTQAEDGRVVVNEAFDFDVGPPTQEQWTEGRQLWASVWAGLSALDQESPAYQAALLDVVALFARGENHVALRTGERVQALGPGGEITQTDEFEYREFYLNDQWMLSTRKLRREPMKCAGPSATLLERINEDWDPATETFQYDYMLGERNLSNNDINEVKIGCGGALPFGQCDADGTPPCQLRAKFARFVPAITAWTIAGDDEAKRHQLALGTCTGCHALETQTAGFHIAPRLPGENSVLSAFLSGGARYERGGQVYTYSALNERVELMERFLRREDVPGEQLNLP